MPTGGVSSSILNISKEYGTQLVWPIYVSSLRGTSLGPFSETLSARCRCSRLSSFRRRWASASIWGIAAWRSSSRNCTNWVVPGRLGLDWGCLSLDVSGPNLTNLRFFWGVGVVAATCNSREKGMASHSCSVQ